MEEQRGATLEFPEDGAPEEEEGKRQRLTEKEIELTPKQSETAREGDSSIDGGLRRRCVNVSGETAERKSTAGDVIPLAIEYKADDFFEDCYNRRTVDDGEINYGSASRRILEPEMPHRDQPSRSKKRHKNRPSVWVELKKRPTHARLHETIESSRHTEVTFPFLKELTTQTFWKTGVEFLNPSTENSYAIFVLRDFILYLLFMTVVWVITFGSRGSAHNYYSDVFRRLVTNSSYNSSLGAKISFQDIQFTSDMWTFIIDVLCMIIYDKTLVDKSRSIYFGAPRMRQLRVRGETCTPAPMFQSLYIDCADYYSESIEDKDDFGLKTSAWRYLPPDGAQSYFTGLLSTYPDGGFTMNFTADRNFTKNEIAQLRDEDWIRFGTRAIFVDFVLFSPDTDLFCVCKVIFEFPPFGGILPSFSSSTLKLLRYVNPWDYFILSCEMIFICFTISYTLEELLQIYRLWEKYLSNWWNILDILIVICCYVAIMFGIISAIKTRNFVERNINSIHTSNHVSFTEMVDVQSRFDESMAMVVFVTWLKIFKFSSLSTNVSTILAAFIRARWFLIVVTGMLTVVLMGGAVCVYVLLAPVIHGFETLGKCVITLIHTIPGGVHYNNYDSYHALSNFGTIWSLLGTGTGFFLLIRVVFLNLYVALIANGFEEEIQEINVVSSPTTITDVFRQMFCKFLRFIGRDQTAERITHRAIIKQDVRIYNALVAILRRHGCEGLEIDLMMEKHEIISGFHISEKSMTDLYDDIHVRKQLSLEVEEHDELHEKMDQIVKNMLIMDHTQMELLTKIDILTDRYILKKKGTPISI